MNKFYLLLLFVSHLLFGEDSLSVSIDSFVRYDAENDTLVFEITPCIENNSNEIISLVRESPYDNAIIHADDADMSFFYDFHLSESTDGRLYKESESDYSIVELKPGGITLLPAKTTVQRFSPNDREVNVIYKVEQSFAEMMDVWSGEVSSQVKIKIVPLYVEERYRILKEKKPFIYSDSFVDFINKIGDGRMDNLQFLDGGSLYRLLCLSNDGRSKSICVMVFCNLPMIGYKVFNNDWMLFDNPVVECSSYELSDSDYECFQALLAKVDLSKIPKKDDSIDDNGNTYVFEIIQDDKYYAFIRKSPNEIPNTNNEFSELWTWMQDHMSNETFDEH